MQEQGNLTEHDGKISQQLPEQVFFILPSYLRTQACGKIGKLTSTYDVIYAQTHFRIKSFVKKIYQIWVGFVYLCVCESTHK